MFEVYTAASFPQFDQLKRRALQLIILLFMLVIQRALTTILCRSAYHNYRTVHHCHLYLTRYPYAPSKPDNTWYNPCNSIRIAHFLLQNQERKIRVRRPSVDTMLKLI